jgi:hypothetical protein
MLQAKMIGHIFVLGLALFTILRFDFGIVQTLWWVCLHFITDVK